MVGFPTPTVIPPITGPLSTLQTIIPSYLYQEYSDDDDLQSFVDTYNQEATEYLGWFNGASLPVYAGNAFVAGAVLDWVALGLYGMMRPTLPSGTNQNIGTPNTFVPNYPITPNGLKIIGPSVYWLTDDDTFKRILTWHLYKGDGKVFNIRWLKRRVSRFLFGVDGLDCLIDQTYQISVQIGGSAVTIDILPGIRSKVSGAMANTFICNKVTPNQLNSIFTAFSTPAFAPTLKAAIAAGVLELPFQFTYTVVY